MDVAAQLDRLRQTHPAIEAAAFVDFRSGTVLCSSAQIAPPQERLDTLCHTAANLLGGPAGDAKSAMMLTAQEAGVLRRPSEDASEALCLICAPDADLPQLETAARETAAEIASAGA